MHRVGELPETQQLQLEYWTALREHLSQAKALLPPTDLLEAMTGLMGPLLDRQISNHLELRTLAATRDARLPKLLSGEIRITNAEAFVGDAT